MCPRQSFVTTGKGIDSVGNQEDSQWADSLVGKIIQRIVLSASNVLHLSENAVTGQFYLGYYPSEFSTLTKMRRLGPGDLSFLEHRFKCSVARCCGKGTEKVSIKREGHNYAKLVTCL